MFYVISGINATEEVRQLTCAPDPHGSAGWGRQDCRRGSRSCALDTSGRICKIRYCKSKKHNLYVLRHTGRAYKRSIRNDIRQYERNFNTKLRSLKTGNPGEFWKLIDYRSTNDGKDTKHKIQLNVLSGY